MVGRLPRPQRRTEALSLLLTTGLANVVGHGMGVQFELADVISVEHTGEAQTCLCKMEQPVFSAMEAEAWERETRREVAGLPGNLTVELWRRPAAGSSGADSDACFPVSPSVA